MGRGAGRGALRRVCAARCPRDRIGRRCAVVPRRLSTRTLRLRRQTCRGHFGHFYGRLVERGRVGWDLSGGWSGDLDKVHLRSDRGLWCGCTYGFLSGWYFLLRVRYAFLISRSEASLSNPSSCEGTIVSRRALKVSKSSKRELSNPRKDLEARTYLIEIFGAKS